MPSIALTGGIAAGKSMSSDWLRSCGIPVLDTDDLSRQLTSPGQPALAEVREAFGDRVIGPDGALDRRYLAKLVFGHPAALTRLESILHPKIQAGWTTWLGSRMSEGVRLAVVVIPLLYEKGHEGRFDRVIAVGCTPPTQLDRLRARGWDEAMIDGRLAAQWPMTEKLARADRVVWTEGSPESTNSQWDRLLGDPVLVGP
jgi:dephospho-CoA kinase